ncbi:MAG: hypothetical protein J6K16_04735 [Alphaproteobacteria bacterium]|nr:hypothetical protein [Alphaproteobacteria bacterium]
MKKTFKIFLTSFAVSMFIIWATNELLFSVSAPKSNSIDIPQRSIALFFQNDNNVFSASGTKDIKSAKLEAIIKEQKKNDNFSIDYALFTVESETADGIGISSIEDAADIPLEYAPVKSKKASKPLAENKKNTHLASLSLPQLSKEEEKIALADIKEDTDKKDKDVINNSIPQPIKESTHNVVEKTDNIIAITDNNVRSTKENNEAEFIPIEENKLSLAENKIKIEEKAPDSQIAMVSSGVADNNAISQLNKETENTQKEWSSMSEEENPWVVAKANVFAKNNKAVEEFANSVSDEEIDKLLNPDKMEEDGEIQTAEMVKNILIPIPDEIMNDKNLTPQLVSPKKTLEKDDVEEDVQHSEESTEKDTLLKSITSIFSSSSDDTENSEEEGDSGNKKKGKKKKGLFAAFSKDKASSKILPAEMRLSFQPGRAEISGQTLRWVQAFANKATEDDNIILEIRIDKNSSYALQQRRLDLLHTILNNKGIGEGKVNTVFTSREPNSFIIRTLRINDNLSNKPVTKNQQKKSNYQTW